MSAKELWIDDINLLDLNKESKWVKIRGQKIGYIPQDPLTSLNPTRKIGKQLLDSLNQNSEWKTKPLAEKKRVSNRSSEKIWN